MEKLLTDSVQDVIKQSDVLIIGNRSKEHEMAVKNLKSGPRVVDLTGLQNSNDNNVTEVNYEGICW